jgi:hypothetical protein
MMQFFMRRKLSPPSFLMKFPHICGPWVSYSSPPCLLHVRNISVFQPAFKK